MRFVIVVISPPGYPHSAAFREVAELMGHGLKELGHAVRFAPNPVGAPDELPIVFGANLLSPESRLPDLAIIFNLEQVDPQSPWIRPEYLNLLRRHRVWDYSCTNLQRLQESGVERIQWIPIGHSLAMERIPLTTPDIDVLFYGSMNPRRQRVIEELRQRGLQVTSVFGVYGAARDQLIARAKIVVNIHFYESKIFELVRISDLLSNGRCVVSESGNDPIEQDFRDVVCFASYEALVDRCHELVRDEQSRNRVARRALDFMRSRPQSQFLSEAIAFLEAPTELANREKNTMTGGLAPINFSGAVSPSAKGGRLWPDRLNVGSGKDFRADFLNLDILPEWGPDIQYDLNQPPPAEGLSIQTRRFGAIKLETGCLALILCQDILEHVPQLTVAMTTFLHWLKVDGVLQIQVPYDLSYGAWQDPTHVRAFNEKSWLYYTDWYWYLGWGTWRFHQTSLKFLLSPLGQSLAEQGLDHPTLIRTPRAVDAMQVELVKRPLTEVEKSEFHRRRSQRSG